MAIVITEEASVTDIDEAMRHIQTMLAEPGIEKNRRNLLLSSLDDLLDARLEITQLQDFLLELEQEADYGNQGSSTNNIKALPEQSA
jgi:hypothetical protein